MHRNGESNGVTYGDGTSRYTIHEQRLGEARHIRIVCIGAGAAGLNLAHNVQKHMRNVDLCVYEKNAGVGGTWLENRCVMLYPCCMRLLTEYSYPGVGCDIPSHNDQYTWAPNPSWNEY